MPSRGARTTRTKPYKARKSLGDQEALLSGIAPAGADGMPSVGIGMADEGGMEVPIDEGAPPPTQLPDSLITADNAGGMVVEFGAPNINRGERPDFDANLAEYLDGSTLNNLAEQVLVSTEDDKESRADWESMMSEGIKQLGLKIEDREWPFPGASGVYDTLMMEAVSRDHAMTCAELLPAGGPVKTQIIGATNDQLEAQASRVKEWFNFYLTEGAPEYYDDRDQMFFWRALVGSTFTKTYQDPILGRPVSPFITPDNFIVSFTTSHLDTSPRYTHIIPMNPREMRLRQLSGFYRDVSLGTQMPSLIDQGNSDAIRDAVRNAEGRQARLYDKDVQYRAFEQHVDLDLDGFEHTDGYGQTTGLPCPYIVTVDEESKEVLAVRRNWRMKDPTCRKIQYFTHYKFMPGLGFYGYGYAHILGNPTKAATSLQRQIIDAATLNMFPGGMTNAQLKTGDNNVNIGPCEFRYVETGGQPIQNAIMAMPYKEVSPVTLALLQNVRENSRNLANAQEIAVGEGRQDAPVGTTVALLEAATRVQAANIKRAHRAMRQEFKLFAALFGEYLPEAPYPYPTSGGAAIMKQDFSNRVDIIPVSDPNITSSAQRMMRAEVYLRMSAQNPDIYDKYAVNRNMLVEMGADESKIAAILPPPAQAVAMDPLSENQYVLLGKPITTAEYQDHEAHIAAHQVLEQLPAMQSHIAAHVGEQMRQHLQQAIGQALPPLGAKLPPELENQLAALVAQKMKEIQKPSDELTPEAIAMAQIKVEAERVSVLQEDSKRKQQTEAFKATLAQSEAERDRQSRERIAQQRNAAELERARLSAAAKPKGKDNGK